MANIGNHISGNWEIKRTTCKYSRTASGKSWKAKPDGTSEEIINAEHYNNFVDSIAFFNNWDNGTCRGYRGYTFAGYVITKVTTISPWRDTKFVVTFEFIR